MTLDATGGRPPLWGFVGNARNLSVERREEATEMIVEWADRHGYELQYPVIVEQANDTVAIQQMLLSMQTHLRDQPFARSFAKVQWQVRLCWRRRGLLRFKRVAVTGFALSIHHL